MKQLIASRRLKNNCICCNKTINKGDIYYRDRKVFVEDKIYGFTTNMCARCTYEIEQHDKRYKEFRKVCTHPQEFIETEWSYIPGECVKEPNYDYCRLCGEVLN